MMFSILIPRWYIEYIKVGSGVGLYKIFVCVFGDGALVNTILDIPHLLYCTPPPLYGAINIAQSMVSPPHPLVPPFNIQYW